MNPARNRWSAIALGLGLALALPLTLTACGDDATAPPLPTCNALSCASGCCDANGTCVTQNPPNSCGIFGGECTAWKQCGAEESCDPIGRTCIKNTVACGPATCPDGCCAGNTCIKNADINNCGARGAACIACGATESCIDGNCQVDCGPATCADGCCQNNVCFGGTNAGLCGKGGANCKECGDGEVCKDKVCTKQACDPTNCQGCCDANGNCVIGDTEQSCGKAGIACKECGSGEICGADRVCKTPTVNCDATSCPDGCCDTSGNCVKLANQDKQNCGQGGGACNTCAASQECASGKCTCTAASCTSGCCEGDSCRSGSDNTACGKAGGKCDTCGGSESCQSGECKSTYDCSKQCAGCCDGNTCITNGTTNNLQCGKGGVACTDCTKNSKTCQNGVCLGTGLCGACGPGTCCSITGCTAGDKDATCGDNGDPCNDCTKELLPMVCDTTTRKCAIDPNSTWKIVIDKVELNTSYNFEGSPSATKPWNAPDPFVEVWHSVSSFAVKKSTKTVDDKYDATFNEIVMTKVKASALLPNNGKANFALRVWDDDTWPNFNDDIAYCKNLTLTTADFGGGSRQVSDCSAGTSYWPTYKIKRVIFRILPD
jgi:hypothetical protein